MNREQIKDLAVRMAKENGLVNLSRSGLCAAAEIPDGSFTHIVGCSFTDFILEVRKEVPNELAFKKVVKTRTNPQLRKDSILAAAVQASEECGYMKVTSQQIADLAGVSPSLVWKYFGTMNGLRRAIMRRAVTEQNIKVIAQGLDAGDNQARRAPEEIIEKAQSLALGV